MNLKYHKGKLGAFIARSRAVTSDCQTPGDYTDRDSWHSTFYGATVLMPYTTTLALALAVRVSIALTTRTFFQPDEYFQALEPAHFIVFGYGDLTWEWTSKPPIRNILYPALNVPIYWVLQILSLDQTFLLVSWVSLPRLLESTNLPDRRLLRQK